MNRRITNYAFVKKSPDVFLTISKNEIKPAEANTFYLKDGQEFEIKLHNKTDNVFLAKLHWNGKKEKSGIVLEAGQTVYLERFVDTNNRLTFKSFEIPEEIEDLVKSSIGELKVEFYKEKSNFTIASPAPYEPYKPFEDPWKPNWPTTPWYSQYSDNTIESTLLRKEAKSTIIGKIDKGEKTDQVFGLSSRSFETMVHSAEIFRLKPIENKPADTLIRKYCSECGARRKTKWKYCPFCGEKN